MSKPNLIASLTLLVSLAVVSPRAFAEPVTDTQWKTEAAVIVDPCAAQLNRDLRACDVNYHRCMEAAHTAQDQLACVDANTQCMLNAIDRYFDCISRTPVPETPAPAPAPVPVPVPRSSARSASLR